MGRRAGRVEHGKPDAGFGNGEERAHLEQHFCARFIGETVSRVPTTAPSLDAGLVGLFAF